MGPVPMVISSTLGWPALQLAVFLLRFRHLPPGGAAESLVFLPMGFVAGIVAAGLIVQSASDRQRSFVIRGYLLASPFALVGALLGGLVLPGVWGPLVAGGIPLAIGCLIGFVTGRPRHSVTS
ncbi:MAG TPA: hypothetical protein VLA05_10970 [Coriobacteriia bacterium]|nr:hypothetical protein [Coriobacteriia bacterium]